MASRLLFWAALMTAAARARALATTPAVRFSNTAPRRNAADGSIIDAHDGNYLQDENGTWWYWGMGYGLCNETGTVNGCDPKCGYSSRNVVGVWSSPDLANDHWTRRGEVLPYNARPAEANCTWFRAHGAYAAATRKWVVWINAIDCAALGRAGYITATADHPSGPYEYNGIVETQTAGNLGDLDLFIDPADGTGYVAMTRCCGAPIPPELDRRIVVERLAPDLLSTVAASATFGPSWVEAPAMFARKGTYYVFTGGCTCFGLGGAGVVVNSAPSPLGPWTTRTVRLDPGCAASKWPHCVGGEGCAFRGNATVAADGHCGAGGPGPPFFPQVCRPVTQAQQNAVITYRSATSSGADDDDDGDDDDNDDTPRFIWTGDRWQSGSNGTGAPPPGLKGWDFQTWLPLQWNDTASPPVPLPLRWVDSFDLAFALAAPPLAVDDLEPGPTLSVRGDTVDVWAAVDQWKKCHIIDVPDVPAKFFLDDQNITHLVAGSTNFHVSLGTPLKQTRDCRVAWNMSTSVQQCNSGTVKTGEY